MKRYGTKYGGFFLPERMNLDEKSVIYSFGVGEDISFDVNLSHQYGSHIHLFDPTPRAVSHVELFKTAFDNNLAPDSNPRYGGGDSNYVNYVFKRKIDSNKLIMHDYGLYTSSGEVCFYEPVNKEHVSFTIETKMRPNNFSNYIIIYVKDLETIMSDLGHTEIDLLKIDIEGVECEVLNQMLDKNIYPKYLCVDFDARRSNIKKDEYQNCLARLLQKYKIIKNDNFDISFELK